MRMNTKKALGIFFILFIAGAVVLFAQDATAIAYRDGYLKGYSVAASSSRVGNTAATAANTAGYSLPTTKDRNTAEAAQKQRLRDSYISGYNQGFADQRAGKANVFL